MASLSPSRAAAAAPAATAMPTKVAGSSSARAPASSALTRRTPSSNRLASMTLSSMPPSSSAIASSANQSSVAVSVVPSALPRGPSFSGKGKDVFVSQLLCREY